MAISGGDWDGEGDHSYCSIGYGGAVYYGGGLLLYMGIGTVFR